MRRAMCWSMVVPASMSAPVVFFGFSAHRYAAATKWSAPVTPSGASADCDQSPLVIVTWLRNGSSGSQMYGYEKSRPSRSGIQ